MSSKLSKTILHSYKNCVTYSRRNFVGIARSYQRTLDKRPYLVQAIQAGILMGAGDLCAQRFFSSSETVQIDYIRTLKFCSIGFVFVGPSVRFWYGVMDKAIKAKSPAIKTMIKVGIDQLIFAPIFIAALVSTISYTQDQNIQTIKGKLRTEYTDILLCNYYVWPWVQIVNFRFVPLNYQVLLTQCVAFLWNIYISWKTHSTVHKKVSA
ncbi:hypothetical protein HA402_015562 [Bradysia odoriphaga]|nr:hypothetical protein HA402_015562 [Bradysia odoriphaga]